MIKQYSVFIELSADELVEILHPVFKRKGLLKDIPNDVEPVPFEKTNTSIEYHWEDEVFILGRKE